MSDQSENSQPRNEASVNPGLQDDPLKNRNLQDQSEFGHQGSSERYSYQGEKGAYDVAEQPDDDDYDDDDTEQDAYGDQDQFGDIDGNDPYSNLDDDTPERTPAGIDPDPDALYGLEEPLAKPGDMSRQGSNKDRYGTRRSQDQSGYQQ